MILLQVSGIEKAQPDSFVLKDIHFIQQAQQKLAIAGETGSGKTTLLKIIAGLIQPDSGTVWFEEQRVQGPDEQLVPGHPAIAYLSQHYELRNNYRVEELLEYANKLPAVQAQALYDVCRISHLVKRRTDQLSGGEKQRIALARLLVGSPKLLLLDEPFSNLDPIHKTILKSVIRDIGDRLSITCLLTSHDPLDTLSWAEEILVLKDGAILQKGAPEEIYRRPVSEYVAGLFGAYYLLDAEKIKQFTGSAETCPPGKRLFIRPEDFSLTNDNRRASPATVAKTTFFGSYSETEVLLNGHVFSVRSMNKALGKGDAVAVHLSVTDAWYL